MVNFILLFISLFLIWTGLVFPQSGQEMIVGVILSFSISILAITRMKGKRNFKISGIIYGIKFIFVFIWELIVANLIMAKIVLSPILPISPKIVKVHTTIESKIGRAFLANAITLTPGTLTIDLIDNDLYIHVVDGNGLKSAESIVEPFEKNLKGVLDI
ncbi:MAG: Na+/H+ antiporter subunit E [Peptostreptococcaceae bacterium]|nr:Na+/H+ antiporter subunit E [Peptostreptococcaceae bacterium]